MYKAAKSSLLNIRSIRTSRRVLSSVPDQSPICRTLHLVDATSLLFMSYYSPGGKIVCSSNGMICTAIAKMTIRLERFLNLSRATQVILVFDSGNAIKRDILPSYKGTRKEVIIYLSTI